MLKIFCNSYRNYSSAHADENCLHIENKLKHTEDYILDLLKIYNIAFCWLSHKKWFKSYIHFKYYKCH